MSTFGDGAWKEGRTGGASFVYVGLDAGQTDQVQANHTAVHIRATLACEAVNDRLAPLASLNWDLAMLGTRASEELACDLARLDGRVDRGVVLHLEHDWIGTALYRVGDTPQTIPTPGPRLERALGSFVLPGELDKAKGAIERVVAAGAWAIWRVDGVTLNALTLESHRQLLQWLGDHHGRIWCAPVRDIATWRP